MRTDTWAESARDLIHFLLYYLPMNPGTDYGELPTRLKRLPEVIAQSRRKSGFVGERTLVGLGHSAGASALSAISIFHAGAAVSHLVNL